MRGFFMLIDSHCHIDFDELAPLGPLLDACRQVGVEALVVPGVSLDHLSRPLELARQHPMLWPAAGFHPWYLPADKAAFGVLEDFARRHAGELVAIGEAGLDKFKGPDAATQEWWLERQLELAASLNKPIILHSVGTHARLTAILKNHPGARGVVHAFSGSGEQARDFVRLGFYLGVGGVITRASATKTRQALAQVPLASLLLETDAPSMLPEGISAAHNSPAFLPLIHKALSEALQVPLDDLGLVLTANARRLFQGAETG
ncbi:deoxyribonuclease YjjV [Gallaecimonas xiamenensis 3-C-1]|uniref:Deoxyribonuclease YjjV n=2 Tax=Gallaecimonas TaxID=745410 RepID=K2JC68_9GAMM|nr:deoxyribonuclease YjjV [Gallaecimonas xiamenensis 3-C-1]